MDGIRTSMIIIGLAILIILISIGYYWYTNNLQMIQAIAPLINALITLSYIFLVYKSTQILSLRPHSERLLEKEISPWLNKTITKIFVLNPLGLPDDEKYIEEFEFEKLPLLFEEHLKSGYNEIYLKYKNWEEKTKEHNEKLKKFVGELRNIAKIKIGLPSSSDFPNRGKVYCYYQRMISDLLTLIIANRINGELNYLKREFKIEVHGGKYSIRPYGSELIEGILVGSPESAKLREMDEFIKEILNSQKIIEEAINFYTNYDNLVKELEILRNEIIMKIEDELKAGGLIKGRCRACP
jgi:predicted metal-dependent hydrolase